MKAFRHAGDLGDIVCSLPVIRHHGGGVLYIEATNYTRQPLTPANFAPIVPLLMAQPYITDVREWKGEPVDVNLNDFRSSYFKALGKDINQFRNSALWWWYQEVFDVPGVEWTKPWLEVPEYKGHVAPVILNQTRRYINPGFPWSKVFRKYKHDWEQIGLLEEMFLYADADPGVFHRTSDLLEAAQLIDAAKLFIGNQSCCFHIAQGLGKPFVLEVYPAMPNCCYPPRPNTYYGWDNTVTLPDLETLP